MSCLSDVAVKRSPRPRGGHAVPCGIIYQRTLREPKTAAAPRWDAPAAAQVFREMLRTFPPTP